jgi:hypothetical protein
MSTTLRATCYQLDAAGKRPFARFETDVGRVRIFATLEQLRSIPWRTPIYIEVDGATLIGFKAPPPDLP